MRNYFTIAGRDSRDFGIYISGQGTFNSPQKLYEQFSIPGRDGAIFGSDRRLENVELTYPCFIYDNFSENIAAFRTFLLSLDGYQRLTDTYHPDEFRMAIFSGPLVSEVTSNNKAGSFDLSFNCKPQRFLMTGETVYGYVPSAGAGSIGNMVIGSDIDVFCPLVDVNNSFRWTYEANNASLGSPEPFSPVVLDGAENANLYVNGVLKESLNAAYSSWKLTKGFIDFVDGSGNSFAFLLRCPTTGWTALGNNVFIYVFSALPGNVANVETLRACSHYTLFPLGGDLSNNPYAMHYATATHTIYIKDARFSTVQELEEWLAQTEVMIDVKIDVLVSASIGYTFDFPDGYARISSGDPKAEFTVVYTNVNGTMENPTEFPSKPLIRAYGTGKFSINDIDITISQVNNTFTDIDCDIMDCYEGNVNRNNYVAFSTYDFPVLKPGENKVKITDNTITAVEIIPRWWRV